MYQHILLPVDLDHEERGRASMAVARLLLDKGGKITILHVMEELPGFAVSQLPEGILQKNREAAVLAVRQLAGGAPDVATEVRWGHAGRTILEFAGDNDVDCIVMASHQPGLEDYFLGSTAGRVVRHAHCSVHVIR